MSCRVVVATSSLLREIDISCSGPDQSVFQPNPSNRKFLTSSSSTSLSLYNRRLEDWKKRREDITIYPLPFHYSCQGEIWSWIAIDRGVLRNEEGSVERVILDCNCKSLLILYIYKPQLQYASSFCISATTSAKSQFKWSRPISERNT